MTTHPTTPQPVAHAASAVSQVQVHCPKCQHGNAWDQRFCGQCAAWLGEAKQAALAEANRLVATHPEVHVESHDRSIGFYALVFFALGLATFIEILFVEFVDTKWLRLTGLFSMSTVKFVLVAMFFMHLKGDKRMYGAMFIAGLVTAAGVLFALQALFFL